MLRPGYLALKLSAALCVALFSVVAPAQNWKPLRADGAFGVTEDSIKSLENDSMRAQMMATYLTYVGRQDLQTEIDGRLSGPKEACIADEDEFEWRSAADWILNAASGHRVVMFNENHYRVESRAFVLELLPELREMGFTHVGFEAFANLREQARRAAENGRDKREYAPEWGSYTHEPVFAALVRGAQALGFEVFGYETSKQAPDDLDMQERIAMRERSQARHLIAVLEEAGDDARFVIFAGWSHIAEEPLYETQRWMAVRFKERTGIDPLTIDTTTCTYAARVDAAATDLKLPFDDEGRPLVVGHFLDAVDAQLHLPVPADSKASGFRRSVLGVAVDIPADFLLEDQRVLVRARRTDRPSQAVPDDQVLVRPGESLQVYLPSGHEYEITGHRGDGSITERQVISVH